MSITYEVHQSPEAAPDAAFDALRRMAKRNHAVIEKSNHTSWLRAMLGTCGYCVGAGAGGLLAGHAGCLAAPALSTIIPEVAAFLSPDPYSPLLMLGLGAGIDALVLGGWYAVRGRFVSKPIKIATVAFAIASLGVTTAIQTPHMYDMQQAYASLTHNDPHKRVEVARNAQMIGQSLDEYVMAICNGPDSPTATMSAFDKIKAAFTP